MEGGKRKPVSRWGGGPGRTSRRRREKKKKRKKRRVELRARAIVQKFRGGFPSSSPSSPCSAPHHPAEFATSGKCERPNLPVPYPPRSALRRVSRWLACHNHPTRTPLAISAGAQLSFGASGTQRAGGTGKLQESMADTSHWLEGGGEGNPFGGTAR
jgi:hypothetical protein